MRVCRFNLKPCVFVLPFCIAFLPLGCGGCGKNNVAPAPGPAPAPTALEKLRASWKAEADPDWGRAELLASISDDAYQSPLAAETSYRKLGFEAIVPVLVDSMAAYVMSWEDVTIIAFRGTDNPANWLVDLDIVPIDTPHGEIHKGFWTGYKSLKPEIIKAVRGKSPKYLWTTGHSLGGALAVVCAYDTVENEKLGVHGVMTFGQPRVARNALAGYLAGLLSERYVYFVNDADVVPRVPPGYSTCGSQIWFTGGGIRRSKPEASATGSVAKALEVEALPALSEAEFEELKKDLRRHQTTESRPDGRPVFKGNIPWLKDHSMALYLDKIRSFVAEAKAK